MIGTKEPISMETSVVLPAMPAPRWRVSWWMVVLVIALVLLLAGLVYFRPWKPASGISPGEKFYTTLLTDLDVKVSTKGELQAVKNTDVENKVEGATQIIWLEKEGVQVEKGAILCKLDSTLLEQRKEQLDLDLRKAESNVKIAEEVLAIQKMQNATNEEAADVAKQLADLSLKQYLEGTYKQQLETAKVTLEMARILLKNKEEDYEQTKSLFAKGFVTPADVKKAELDVTSQGNEVKKAETALRVLQEYSHPMERKRLESDLAQAQQKLARTKRQSLSLETQATADLDEKQASLRLLRDRSDKLNKQIEACTIRAPEPGLIIYMSSINRWDQQSQIVEGGMARQNQIMFRLPDVRQMKAVCRVQESQKLKLREGDQRAVVKIAGIPNPVGATLTKVAPLPDASARWSNPDAKEYPIELVLDETPPGLKPGTGVESVEILIAHLERVMAVPLSCIYVAGSDAYVFVREGQNLKERKVKLGATTEREVQILEGLAENEDVLQLQAGQGRELLMKAGIKVDDATTRPNWSKRRRNSDKPRAEAPAAPAAAAPIKS